MPAGTSATTRHPGAVSAAILNIVQISSSPYDEKKQRGQCLTLTALKPCLAAPYRAFAGHCCAYRATPRLNRDTSRLTGPRKYYYGLLATKFQSMRRCLYKRFAV